MKHLRKLISAFVLVFTIIIVYTSCKKEVNTSGYIPQGQQRVSIRLSDNPINFDAVNVDIQKIEVAILPDSCRGRRDSCVVWDTLDIKAKL